MNGEKSMGQGIYLGAQTLLVDDYNHDMIYQTLRGNWYQYQAVT